MQKKRIPTGVINYRELHEGNYYVVDKSMMIQEFLERGSKVTLITRPRRFGKTLSLSMLAEFFDITKESKGAFQGTKIMATEYADEINQYPTIFISFLNAKDDKGNVVKYIKEELLREYDRFSFIVEKLRERYQRKYHMIMADLEKVSDSLRSVNDAISFLATCLQDYYDKKVMVFIDEYDTPFVEAHIKDFYDEIHADLATLLRTVLKGNDALQFAMLTGIQRVAKENIFSDLNNLAVYTVSDPEYSQYFGFSEEETKELLSTYGIVYNNEVKNMYNGYNMGGVEIYNPWSIISYASRKTLKPYWVNTSGNSMIKKAMEQSESAFKIGYETLIKNGYLDTEINIETSFYEQSDTNSLWGLFVNAGYLTITKTIDLENNEYRLRIPNKEVESEFKGLTAYHLHVETKELSDLYKGLRNKEASMFLNAYEKLLMANASYFDLTSENSYQMLILGICLYIKNDYEIISNREEGKGRCEVLPRGYLVLKSRNKIYPSYVIELKYMHRDEYQKQKEVLNKLAQEAIDQIELNKYDCELTGEIIHIGLAHAGKDVKMKWVHR